MRGVEGSPAVEEGGLRVDRLERRPLVGRWGFIVVTASRVIVIVKPQMLLIKLQLMIMLRESSALRKDGAPFASSKAFDFDFKVRQIRRNTETGEYFAVEYDYDVVI